MHILCCASSFVSNPGYERATNCWGPLGLSFPRASQLAGLLRREPAIASNQYESGFQLDGNACLRDALPLPCLLSPLPWTGGRGGAGRGRGGRGGCMGWGVRGPGGWWNRRGGFLRAKSGLGCRAARGAGEAGEAGGPGPRVPGDGSGRTGGGGSRAGSVDAWPYRRSMSSLCLLASETALKILFFFKGFPGRVQVAGVATDRHLEIPMNVSPSGMSV